MTAAMTGTMTWQFERVAGPFEGATGGVVWDGTAVLFTTIDEGGLLRFDPTSGSVSEVRRYINRVNALALGPGGERGGAQDGGRRLVEFVPDGRLVAVDALLDGKRHNQPSDLVVDRKHRIWFTDPHHPVIRWSADLPLLEHQSAAVRAHDRRAWTATRITYDTTAPRAVPLSASRTRSMWLTASRMKGENTMTGGAARPSGRRRRSWSPFGAAHLRQGSRGSHRGSKALPRR